jgi:hypothetical protein
MVNHAGHADWTFHSPKRRNRLPAGNAQKDQELFHGLHVAVFPYSLAQLVVFGSDIFVFQCTEKGFVRGELADVEFVQGRHPFVQKMALFFGTARKDVSVLQESPHRYV